LLCLWGPGYIEGSPLSKGLQTVIPNDAVDRLVYFQREVNKLIKTVFSNDSTAAAAKMENMFPLPIDIYEEGPKIRFEIEVPGVEPKSLHLYISNDVLIVEGVKRDAKREGVCNFINMERTFGKFRRLIEIPITANMRELAGFYEKGILTVEIAKVSDRRGERRQINIQTKED